MNHEFGKAGLQSLENAFMKLLISYNDKHLSDLLIRYDIAEESKEALIEVIHTAAELVTLPVDILRKNPNISAYRQESLFRFFMSTIEKHKERGINALIPRHPLRPYRQIIQDYLSLFKWYDHFFAKEDNKKHQFFANRALFWMKGQSYSDMLANQIDYKRDKRKRGIPNVNTEARDLFETIEMNLRFRYVKFSKCYNDILAYCLENLKLTEYIPSIPPLHLFLELGAAAKTTINLIGMGLSRTAAFQLSEIIKNDDLDRAQINRWLRSHSIYNFNLSKTTLSEIEQLL